jgi:hypothetical protein
VIVCKEPVRCKLEIQGKMTEKVMSLKYLGVDITSDGTQQLKFKHQAYSIGLSKRYNMAKYILKFRT